MIQELINILKDDIREQSELEKAYLEASLERSKDKNTSITYSYMVDDNYCLEVIVDDTGEARVLHISYSN